MGTESNEQTSGTNLLEHDDDFAPPEPSERTRLFARRFPFGFHSFRLLPVLQARRRIAGADSEPCFLRGRHAWWTASTLFRRAAVDERWAGLVLHAGVRNNAAFAFRYLRVGSRTRSTAADPIVRPSAELICSTAYAAGHGEACKFGRISGHVGVALNL